MTTEIRHTPIPTAEHTRAYGREDVTLICRECDVSIYAEGNNLDGLAELLTEWHRKRHQEETAGNRPVPDDICMIPACGCSGEAHP